MPSKRIVWMDVARALAIVLVVLCHVVEVEYYDVIMGKRTVSDNAWFFENTLYAVSRFGVPLFLMLSGALLLGREHDVKQFYRHSFLPLLLTTEIWTVINYFYYLPSAFSKKALLYDMLFLKSSPANHMWYMPMILGMYLVIPFLAKALKGVSFSHVLIPLSIGFFAFSIVPLFNTFATEVFRDLPDINLTVDVSFLGGIYGLLLIIGYFITRSEALKKVPGFVFAMLGLLCLICNTAGARYLHTNTLFHSIVFVWYASPFLLIAAICLFICLSKLNVSRPLPVVTALSNGSFAIFLTHNLALHFLRAHIDFYEGYSLPVRTAIRFLFSFGVPALLVFLLHFLPCKRLKKWLFYMK